MRILYFSNPIAGYSSGYATSGYHLVKTLLMQGHEIFAIDCAIPCHNPQKVFGIDQIRGMYAKQQPVFLDNIDERYEVLKRVTFLRYMYDKFPTELYVKDFNQYIEEFQIDVMLFFIDIWIINTIQDKEKFKCRSVSWLPIHFDPVEDRTVEAAKLFDAIVTLSKDGTRKMKSLFPTKFITKIPHIIDLDIFHLDKVDRDKLRDEMGIPRDCYLLTVIWNNSETTNRKCFCANFEAFKKFHDSHPEARLFIHSRLDGALHVPSILRYHGITDDMIIVSDQKKMKDGAGMLTEWVVKLYKCTDCLIASTCSEGFSVPILEANGLGIPVVSTDTTAMPDHTYNGQLAKLYCMKFCIQNASCWGIPDVRSIVKALEKIYNRTQYEKIETARVGSRKVCEGYNLKVLNDGWALVMEKLESSQSTESGWAIIE